MWLRAQHRNYCKENHFQCFPGCDDVENDHHPPDHRALGHEGFSGGGHEAIEEIFQNKQTRQQRHHKQHLLVADEQGNVHDGHFKI